MNNLNIAPPSFFQAQSLDAPQMLSGASFLSLSGFVAMRMVSPLG